MVEAEAGGPDASPAAGLGLLPVPSVSEGEAPKLLFGVVPKAELQDLTPLSNEVAADNVPPNAELLEEEPPKAGLEEKIELPEPEVKLL